MRFIGTTEERGFLSTLITLAALFLAALISHKAIAVADAQFSDVLIRARGTSGNEWISLEINKKEMGQWQLSQDYQNYIFTPKSSLEVGELTVSYINEAPRQDVRVDYIKVNGKKYETEHSSTFSTGTWSRGQGCTDGNKKSEWLHCEGLISYNVPVGEVIGGDLKAFEIEGQPAVNIVDEVAEVSWATSANANGIVLYGTAQNSLNQASEESSNGLLQHQHILKDLKLDTRYFYRVKSVSESGEVALSEVGSFEVVSVPEITSHKDGDVVDFSSEAIVFSANKTLVSEWIIRAGSSFGGREYFESQRLSPNITEVLVGEIPPERDVYLSLNYKLTNGQWNKVDYIFRSSVGMEGNDFSPSAVWSNTIKPPNLSNPQIIRISQDTEPVFMADHGRYGCEGFIYQFTVDPKRDVKVVMGEGSGPLKYPVWIRGGRNAHLLGLDLDLAIQNGCGVGEATNKGLRGENYNPRLPGNIAIRLEQSDTTFVEGVKIEMNGMEADCFVMRHNQSPGSRSSANKDLAKELQDKSKFHVVNTRCAGYDGYDSDEYKTGKPEGIHGDLFQNQGYGEVPGELFFENVTALGTSNGIVAHAWLGLKVKDFMLRNVEYGHDPRYINDASPKTLGLTYSASPERYNFENVWINDSRGLNYGVLWPFSDREVRYGAYQRGNVKRDGGIFGGSPSKSMAPSSKTGLNYESPF